MQARQRNIFSKRVNVRSVCGGSVVGVTCLGRPGDHHLPLLRFHLRKIKHDYQSMHIKGIVSRDEYFF
jgi:hypothetical protein